MTTPCNPTSIHWLGDRQEAEVTRHAVDARGCVLYFERQSDCLQFMRWLGEDKDLAAATAALAALAEHNVSADVQEILVHGNPDRGVAPGALSAAMRAALSVYRAHTGH